MLGRLVAWGWGFGARGGRGREASIVPTAVDVVTAGEEAGAPPPSPRLRNKHLFLQKKKKGEVTGVVAVLST